MSLWIDVIDGGCALRRRAIAVRAERFALSRGIWTAGGTVQEFGATGAWITSERNRDPIDEQLLFLHGSDSGWQEVVRGFALRIKAKLVGRALLVTYSGSPSPLYTFRVDDMVADKTDWWRHYGEVDAVRDFENPAQAAGVVGIERPPVEVLLEELLSQNWGDAARPAVPGGAREGESAARDAPDVRHAVINAVGPLREAALLSLAMKREVGELESLWQHLIERLGAYRERLPDWVRRMVDDLGATVIPGLRLPGEQDGAVRRLIDDLGQVEAYARMVGRPLTNWNALMSALGANPPEPVVRILWIDDEEAWFQSLRPAFKALGIDAAFSRTPSPYFRGGNDLSEFDAMVVDLILEKQGSSVGRMLEERGIVPFEPVEDSNAGIAVLQLLQTVPLAPPAFVLSARESATVVRACTLYGARGYFVKGRADYLRLLTSLRAEAEAARERRRDVIRPANPDLIVGGNKDPLTRTIIWLDHIARSGSRGPVLLVGEPGVGKEELARELHQRSSRRAGPLVVVDCSAIPATLIEGELFGHVRGAFTGAVRDRAGPFEAANGGVLFLDELDKLDPALQNRLLRAVETGTVRRVGENTDRPVDVLLIVASNEDPRRPGGEKRFSPQLLSRVGKFVLSVPALREREDAVEALARGLCARVGKDLGWGARAVAPDALQWLRVQARSGRFDGAAGNVRGLRNLLERALVLFRESDPLGRREIEEVAKSDEPIAAETGSEDAVRQAASVVVESLRGHERISLQVLEDQFRAELLRLLRARMSREQIADLFGWSAENMRQHLMALRKKGLLPPDV